MKKIYLLLLGVTVALVACNQNAPDLEDEGEVAGKSSDYESFVDHLMRTDSLGNIGYMFGDNLNEANPYEISIPVRDYAHAVEIFKEMLPLDAELTQEGDSYTWLMTDANGESEGEIVLEPDSTPGRIATIKRIKPKKLLPHRARFRETDMNDLTCIFIPESAWPENSSAVEELLANEYYWGAVVNKEKDDGFGSGTFIVIRDWTPQHSGLMIQVDHIKHECSWWKSKGFKKCSSKSTLHDVQKALYVEEHEYDIVARDFYRLFYVTDVSRMFMSKSYVSPTTKRIRVGLKSGSEDTVNLKNPNWGAYMVYCYYFKPNGDKIKFW